MRKKMTLKKATLIALIGLCLNLIIKIINTIFPQIVWFPIAAQIITILSVFITASLLLFILYFYKQYLTEDTALLREPTLFLIFMVFIILLLRLKGVLQVLPKLQTPVYNISPGLYGFLLDNSIGRFSPIISGVYALSLLVFFSTLYGVFRGKKSPQLQTATRWAVFGSVLNFLLCTLNILVFYFLKEGSWVENSTQKFSSFILILFLFASSTFMYFIWIFYKYLEEPH